MGLSNKTDQHTQAQKKTSCKYNFNGKFLCSEDVSAQSFDISWVLWVSCLYHCCRREKNVGLKQCFEANMWKNPGNRRKSCKSSCNIISLFICIYFFFVFIMYLSDVSRTSPLLCTFFALTSTLLNIN